MSREAWIVVIVLAGIVCVATLVGAIVLATRVYRTRKLLGTLGVSGKVAFYGALAYTILPVDLLPDPIYLDDLGVLAGALIYLTRLVQQRRTGRDTPLPTSSPQDRDRGPAGSGGIRLGSRDQ